MPKSSYEQYRASLLAVLRSCEKLLEDPNATALDVATHAVSMLEDNPIFNAGKGGVFTRAGTIELESSVMVSNGYQKRSVGCMLLKRTKNPVKLAREMLIRGESLNGGGAQGHCQLAGEYLEDLAEDWGLQMVDPNYFFTKKRWEEHRRGLEQESRRRAMSIGDVATPMSPILEKVEPSWDGKEYLPQGTVGAVVLDRFGTVCVATSTGGLTNKLPGRIGDTPSIGAGFWAEEWDEEVMFCPAVGPLYSNQSNHSLGSGASKRPHKSRQR
jgi:L-asparaginase